jgi:hypothetical protein
LLLWLLLKSATLNADGNVMTPLAQLFATLSVLVLLVK